MMRRWTDRRDDRDAAKIIALAINQGVAGVDEPGSLLVARFVSDERLHDLLGAGISVSARSIVEREIRRREARPTYLVALSAILISFLSLAVW